MRKLVFWWSLALLAAGPAAAATAPVACQAPKSVAARTICDSPELLAMDREIAALYDRGRALTDPDTRRRMVERRQIFLKTREGCSWAAHDSAHPGTAVEECIRQAMDTRLAALRRFVDAGGR